jgi:hypothetical protein
MECRTAADIEARLATAASAYLHATNTKLGVFRDVIIESDYDPLAPLRHTITFPTADIVDPLKKDLLKTQVGGACLVVHGGWMKGAGVVRSGLDLGSSGVGWILDTAVTTQGAWLGCLLQSESHVKVITTTTCLIVSWLVRAVLQTEKQLLTGGSPSGATATGRATTAPSGCTQLERSVTRQVSLQHVTGRTHTATPHSLIVTYIHCHTASPPALPWSATAVQTQAWTTSCWPLSRRSDDVCIMFYTTHEPMYVVGTAPGAGHGPLEH